MVNFYIEIPKRTIMEREPSTPPSGGPQTPSPHSLLDAQLDGDIDMDDGHSPTAPTAVSPLTPEFGSTYLDNTSYTMNPDPDDDPMELSAIASVSTESHEIPRVTVDTGDSPRIPSSAEPPAVPLPSLPAKMVPNGAPARRYLNEKVTGVLLEGMKMLARDQPPDPLRVLGEYLVTESARFEREREVG